MKFKPGDRVLLTPLDEFLPMHLEGTYPCVVMSVLDTEKYGDVNCYTVEGNTPEWRLLCEALPDWWFPNAERGHKLLAYITELEPDICVNVNEEL